jgi:hypothetical protein
MFLIFDTETTGLPRNWNAPLTDADNWPRCIQIAWQLHSKDGSCLAHEDYLVVPDGFVIPYDAEKIHRYFHCFGPKRWDSFVGGIGENFNRLLLNVNSLEGIM